MEKKTIIVIGAGKGNGNAIAKEFASHDFRVATDGFAAKKGAILFTGGGFAKTFKPIPILKPLCIDKAALNAMNIVLHYELEPKGIFVGSIQYAGRRICSRSQRSWT